MPCPHVTRSIAIQDSARERWGMATALGFPVVPEVNSTYARLCAATDEKGTSQLLWRFRSNRHSKLPLGIGPQVGTRARSPA